MSAAHDALRGLLAAARTPAQMEALATELERIAALTRDLAAAKRRQQTRPAAARATPRDAHAGPGRAPAMFVRLSWEPWGREGRERPRLYVGRGLWYAIGSPARMDLQRVGGRLELRPAPGDAGLAFTAGKGMPRAFVDGWADILRLDPGRYAAEVAGGAIVIGERLD